MKVDSKKKTIKERMQRISKKVRKHEDEIVELLKQAKKLKGECKHDDYTVKDDGVTIYYECDACGYSW